MNIRDRPEIATINASNLNQKHYWTSTLTKMQKLEIATSHIRMMYTSRENSLKMSVGIYHWNEAVTSYFFNEILDTINRSTANIIVATI